MRTRARWEKNPKLEVSGREGDVKSFLSILDGDKGLALAKREPDIRLLLMEYCDEHPEVVALYDGNTVWRRKPLVENMELIVKTGDVGRMSEYLYSFLSLSCGSIAHYNKQGWIAAYPTVKALRAFFELNEYGQPVLLYVPSWKADAKEIAFRLGNVLGAHVGARR